MSYTYDQFLTLAESTVICDGFGPGGLLDVFCLLFRLAGGDVVNLWGDGALPAGSNPPRIYGVSLGLGYDFEGVGFTVPEPSTWAMMILSLGGIGLAGDRRSRKAAAVAA